MRCSSRICPNVAISLPYQHRCRLSAPRLVSPDGAFHRLRVGEKVSRLARRLVLRRVCRRPRVDKESKQEVVPPPRRVRRGGGECGAARAPCARSERQECRNWSVRVDRVETQTVSRMLSRMGGPAATIEIVRIACQPRADTDTASVNDSGTDT